jgi:putative nucleotidyltransferase with HDIG domain
MSDIYDGSGAGHAGAWRAELAERMCEDRARLADSMIARLGARTPGATPLMARTLVNVIAKAIETSDADAVTQWAQAVRVSHQDHAIVDLVNAVCETAVAYGQRSPHADLSSLLVFLEILRERTRSALVEGRLPSRAETMHRVVIESVLALLKARDEATCIHSQATGYWCRRLAEEMKLGAATTDQIVRAGMLHDIGKIATPDRILFKTGGLDDEEWAVMRQHPIYGAEILSEIPALAPYAPIVRAHHENFDGTGYPDGLRGTEIPFEARVVAVADAFHAMVSDRPYRAARSYGEAMAILTQGRGTQWDAEITDVMVRIAAAERSRSADAGLAAITEPFLLGELPHSDTRAM